ncbi:MAG: hypothetical protein WBF17_20015, partial [Phycisphaerae bacterium]
AWLGWIARRLVQDLLRGRARVPTRGLEPEHWQQMPAGEAPARAASRNEQLVRQALEALSEREQRVIRVTFQWYQADKAHQRLPNDVSADLARTLDTTPENLRQIRRRALRKIADFVRSHAEGGEMGERGDG